MLTCSSSTMLRRVEGSRGEFFRLYVAGLHARLCRTLRHIKEGTWAIFFLFVCAVYCPWNPVYLLNCGMFLTKPELEVRYGRSHLKEVLSEYILISIYYIISYLYYTISICTILYLKCPGRRLIAEKDDRSGCFPGFAILKINVSLII